MSEALLFPGQGAQYAGMGQDWAEAHPAARRTLDQANEALGFSLTDAMWGPEPSVDRTDVAQPAILAVSAAVVAVLEADHGLVRSDAPLAAGLSLGEYTALWFAGALELGDALRLVRLRGEAMQDASEACPSSMVSLMGATEESATALAQLGAAHGICQVANLNSPSQIIVSGELAALDAVEAAAKDHGIRRAVRLSVAGAFHSEVMRPAAERLAQALASVEVRTPSVPVLSNVTAAPVGGPDEIRDLLARQLTAPVLWERSMRAAGERGIKTFLEPGPGKVLAGLMRKIDPEAVVRSAATPADLSA
ncbi:MAG: ACP S-malonyltransferase [Planctomycetes bacterium]|nr:ACP S-malonyltransferase [Planctomycetota bacterium]MDA0947710.1 ACP S-malonyltransferase [Planctomycetota bacterium]